MKINSKTLSGHKFTPPPQYWHSQTPFSDKSSLFGRLISYYFSSICFAHHVPPYRKKRLFCFKALWCYFLSDVIHFPSARTDVFILLNVLAFVLHFSRTTQAAIIKYNTLDVINNRNFVLRIAERRSQRSAFWLIQFLLSTLFLVCRQQPSHHVFPRRFPQ